MKTTAFQAKLLQLYGDAAVDFGKSRIQLRHTAVYLGAPSELFLQFDLRNKEGLRVASLPAATLISRLSCYLDAPPAHQQLVLLETTRPGFVHAAFQVEQSLQAQFIRLYYCERLLLEREIIPKDSWHFSNRGVIVEQRVTSHSQAVFYSTRVLFGAVGQYLIQLSESSLAGVCLKDQRSIVYGQQIGPGLVQLQADGQALHLYMNGELVKTIEGLEQRDCVAFVRLRPGKWAEFRQAESVE